MKRYISIIITVLVSAFIMFIISASTGCVSTGDFYDEIAQLETSITDQNLANHLEDGVCISLNEHFKLLTQFTGGAMRGFCSHATIDTTINNMGSSEFRGTVVAFVSQNGGEWHPIDRRFNFQYDESMPFRIGNAGLDKPLFEGLESADFVKVR